MTELVLKAYRYLSAHKMLRIMMMLISSLLFVVLGLQLSYDEDISSLLPSTNNGNEKLAFSSLRVKDKIFIQITSCDSAEKDPDELVEIADEFVDKISEADSADNYIADIFYKIDEDLLVDAIDYLTTNFPQFVSASDYDVIDSLLTDEKIEASMAANYEVLTSSDGMALKGVIASDPIGLRNVLVEKVKNIKEGMGGSHTLYDSHLFTPDTTEALAYISPNFKSFDSQSGQKLVSLLEKQIAQIETEHEGVKIYFHGSPIQSVYNSRQVKKDLALTLVVSLVLICIIILLCFKNLSTIPMMLGPVVYGAFFALTMMYLIKGTMSLLALGIGAIVLGVALSYCLHVITHYKYVSTPEQVLRDQAKPVFLGCLTTIGSFLGLLFTQSDLLNDFGLFASFALVGTTFFSLIFLPHFFNPKRNKKSKKAFSFLERFNAHPFEKHSWLIVIIVVVCCVSFYAQKFVTFDSDLSHIGYTDPNVKMAVDRYADKTQNGYMTTYYAASSYNLDSALVTSRKIVAKLDSLKNEGKINGFSKASNIFLTSDEIDENIEAWHSYWTNEKIATIVSKIRKAGAKYGINAEYFSPFEEILKLEDDVEPLLDADVIPSGLLANMVEHTDSVYMVFTSVQLQAKDKFDIGSEIVSIPDVVVIDPMFYASEMVKTVNDDFNIALNISMAFVFIVLLFSFRNLTLSILAFLPMTLSWFIVLGCMGILGLQFNLINIVISTFIFGIGVDYSIFVMEGLLSKAKSQSEPRLLIYHKTAIFFSAVVLMITTGSLILATHPALKSIGIATIIGMSSAVALAYILQPFLFHVIVKFMLKYKIKAKWLK